jgi:uncharacterized protein HemX
MIYAESHRNIVARLNETSVRVDVPNELNKYDTLRDIVNRLIETVEIVQVS